MTHNKHIVVGGGVVLAVILASGALMAWKNYSALHTTEFAESEMSETRTGVTDKEILIGASSALSGHAASLGINYVTYGADIAVQEFNDNGGVFGRKISLVSYDDQYDPPQAVANTKKLIEEDKVFVLSSYVGTPTGVQVLPLINEHRIPLVGLFTGAGAFRSSEQPYVFNIRASYDEEMGLAIRYFVGTLEFKKIAIFYQNDAFGLAGRSGAIKALSKMGLAPIAEATFERGSMAVEEAGESIGASGAEAVVMVGTYAQLAKFVHLIGDVDHQMKFHTLSFVGPEAFAEGLEEIEEGHNETESPADVFVTQVVPPPYYTDIFDGLDRYAETLHRYYPEAPVTFGGLEGYIGMRVLLSAIESAGRDLTREGLLEALLALRYKDISIGSLLSFDNPERQALHKVFMTTLVHGEYLVVPVR